MQTWVFLSIYNSSITLMQKHRVNHKAHIGSENLEKISKLASVFGSYRTTVWVEMINIQI